MPFSTDPHTEFSQNINQKEEIRSLKNQAQDLKQMLDDINLRLNELTKTKIE